MDSNKKDFPEELKQQLDRFDVTVPPFSINKSKLERMADWLYGPAINPLEALPIKMSSLSRVIFYPLLIIFILSLSPVVFM